MRTSTVTASLNGAVHAKMAREVSVVIVHVARAIDHAIIAMIGMIARVVHVKMVNVQDCEITAL
jgi:hypothetical protein